MPLIVPQNLPAIATLQGEGITLHTTAPEGIQPRRVLLLNLMPFKAETETDFLRAMHTTEAWVEVVPLKFAGQTYKNTPQAHMDAFYRTFDEALQAEHWDGLIATGAPLEQPTFEVARYWEQFVALMQWADTHVRSTLYICWAAQAATYHFYGTPRHVFTPKLSGIFAQEVLHPDHPLLRHIALPFYMPHSRFSKVCATDISPSADAIVVTTNPTTDFGLLTTADCRRVIVTGHLEYPAHTLNNEYHRDMAKGEVVEPPTDYYIDNDPTKGYRSHWIAGAQQFFSNWIDLLRD